MTPDGATGMHWLSDTILGLDYVVITGEDQEAYTDSVARSIAMRVGGRAQGAISSACNLV